MGKCREFDRQSEILQGLMDVMFPGSRPDDAIAKPVRLTALETHIGCGEMQGLSAGRLAPPCKRFLFITVQVLALAIGQCQLCPPVPLQHLFN